MKILLIDKEGALYPHMRNWIRESSHDILFAGDERGAVGLLQGQSCDLAVLEVDAKENASLGFVAQLKSKWPELPLLAVGGDRSSESAIMAMEAGASDYVRGPVQPEALEEALHKLAPAGAGTSPEPPERVAN